MTSAYALISSTPGAAVRFQASRCFDVEFLKHDWSGIAKVSRDGVLLREIDLHSKKMVVPWKEFFGQDTGPHAYTIEVSDRKNPDSASTEVWIGAVLERRDCKDEEE